MATIQFANGKKGLEKVFIKDAVLMYTKVKKASVIYAQKDLPKASHTKFEYTVDLVVDEDVADQWDEQFPKQSASKLLKAAFMKKYKIESEDDFPENLDKKAKKFFVIKLKQNTHYDEYKDGKATGKVLPLSPETRPRCIALIDGKKVDITVSKEVGNTSVGDVLAVVNHHKTYGASAKLKGIFVTSLVEYVGGTDSTLTDFFGDDVEFAELPAEVEVSETGSQSDGGSGDDFEEDDVPPFDLDDEDEDFY